MAATALDMKALNIPLPPEAKNELVIHTEEDDDRMWVPRGEGVWFRPLMYNVTQGSWVNLTRATREGIIGRHRHPAPVTGYTLDGSWGYLEHEWEAKKGTFIYEPAGETHTLVVTPTKGHMLTLFHNFGPLIMVDENGNQTGYEDVFTRIEKVKTHYQSVGLSSDVLDRIIM